MPVCRAAHILPERGPYNGIDGFTALLELLYEGRHRTFIQLGFCRRTQHSTTARSGRGFQFTGKACEPAAAGLERLSRPFGAVAQEYGAPGGTKAVLRNGQSRVAFVLYQPYRVSARVRPAGLGEPLPFQFAGGSLKEPAPQTALPVCLIAAGAVPALRALFPCSS